MLLADLEALQQSIESHTPADTVLAQPSQLRDLAGLMNAMKEKEKEAHKLMRRFVRRVGGRFKPGPMKREERVVAKAAEDYGRNCLRYSQPRTHTHTLPPPLHFLHVLGPFPLSLYYHCLSHLCRRRSNHSPLTRTTNNHSTPKGYSTWCAPAAYSTVSATSAWPLWR